MSRLSLTLLPTTYRVCKTCGQTHEEGKNHVYDYPDEVEEELQCHICFQPLIDPVDTPCRHTFCRVCIHNHLKQSPKCPLDRGVVQAKDIRQSSILVRKLLDKLRVICPNNGYCEDMMQRSVIEQHLSVQCLGTYVDCPRKELGCEFYGPRCNLEEHLWSCSYAPDRTKEGVAIPIVEEQITSIEIPKGMSDLGIKLQTRGEPSRMGGVTIEEVFVDGTAARDNRLRPGDIILKVDKMEVTSKALARAALALGAVTPLLHLTVYRPARVSGESPYDYQVVLIHRETGQSLGLRIMARKHHDGVFVLGVLPNSPAEKSNQLLKGDRLLEVNGVNTMQATVDDVARLLIEGSTTVKIVIGRTQGSITSQSELSLTSEPLYENTRPPTQICPGDEKCIYITKEPDESFGMSIAGGVGSECGDIPIFITSVIPSGPIGRTGQINKGDILLSMNDIILENKTHAEAVQIVKSVAAASCIRMRMIQGEESSDNLLAPEWMQWVSKVSNNKYRRSSNCFNLQVVTLPKPPGTSLGFSVVGGRLSPKGDSPLYIKSFAPQSRAEQDGRLRCGDQLVAVNNISLSGFTQQDFVGLMKRIAGDVALTVYSCKAYINN